MIISSLRHYFNRRYRRVTRHWHKLQEQLSLGVGFEALNLAYEWAVFSDLIDDIHAVDHRFAVAENVE